MSSTFFGLNIGASALNAYSASVNTAANNVANANTVGYSKQVTNLEAGGAIRNYTYGTLGSGVSAESITQLRNSYYDVKYWTNNSYTGQYEKKVYYVEQMQDLFVDFDSTKGFSSIYSSVFNVAESLKGDAGNLNIRNQFISNSQSLMDYFNDVSSSLHNLQSDCNQEIRAIISQINSYAQKIAVINDKINTIEIGGKAYANELRDQRANLLDELSYIVSFETEETEVPNSNYPEVDTGATNFRVKLAGQLLVDGGDYNELECYSRDEKVNQNDIDGLYGIRWVKTGNEFNPCASSMSGQLKAIMEVRDGNNAENFQGTLSGVNGSRITISNPNIKTVDAMSLPEQGYLTIGNRDFHYKEFSMTMHADGTCTYEFVIDDRNLAMIRNRVGKDVNIGTSVDSRGIPYYLTQMNEFLRSFCHKMNNIEMYGSTEAADTVYGLDANGDEMGAFFVSQQPDGEENTFTDGEGRDPDDSGSVTYKSTESNYYYMTADNVKVNARSLKDPNYFATSARTHVDESKAEIVDEILKLQNGITVYRGADGEDFLQYITSDISVDVNEADILANNYGSIGQTIDTYRKSVSSVDEDEEALDLVKFQNAYNLASKIISTMNQMYDRLITQTGV